MITNVGMFSFTPGDTGQATIEINTSSTKNWTSGTPYELLSRIDNDAVNLDQLLLTGTGGPLPTGSYLEFLTDANVPADQDLYFVPGGTILAPMGQHVQSVPEPSTLALLGMAIIGPLTYAGADGGRRAQRFVSR